jgi:hypothetical protein
MSLDRNKLYLTHRFGPDENPSFHYEWGDHPEVVKKYGGQVTDGDQQTLIETSSLIEVGDEGDDTQTRIEIGDEDGVDENGSSLFWLSMTGDNLSERR